MKGRVLRVSGMQCLVEIGPVQWVCPLRGRVKAGQRNSTSPVVVGDWVEVEPSSSSSGIIAKVYPRHSKFSRVASGPKSIEQIIAVNLDQLVVVVATRQPAMRLGFIDRAVVMALKGGMQPVICINKVDLDPESQSGQIGNVYSDIGYRVCLTSVVTGSGIDDFKSVLKDRASVFVGHSGVGKSSLLNCIDPDFTIATKSLMAKHDRGRHTTAAVQLYPLGANGGYIADTPGIKELQLWGVDETNLIEYFTEMTQFVSGCHFRDCRHIYEPECAVQAALERGAFSRVRYEGYKRIMKQMVYKADV